MISEAELKRKAASLGVDPMVMDLDYSLGWFIAAFYAANENSAQLYFKGGTCLRKCYFGEYRFSEDLDFTATTRFDSYRLNQWIERASNWSSDRGGPSYGAAPRRVETLSDAYGDETHQVRIYYRGPLKYTGAPRAIRMDITRDEILLTPAQIRKLIHPYSDVDELEASTITCYSLEEILAEKLRAVGGQRRFAISRDVYDIHQLIQSGVVISDVISLVPTKFIARGFDPSAIDLDQIKMRRSEFERDWERRLSYLVRGETEFEAAWTTTLEALQHLEQH